MAPIEDAVPMQSCRTLQEQWKVLEDTPIVATRVWGLGNLEAREARLVEREEAFKAREMDEFLACKEREQAEARLREREGALEAREEAQKDLATAMGMLKEEMAEQPAAPEVARTPKRRPMQRGRRLLLVASVSPRRRGSPGKARSPTKMRLNKLSAASTTAESSCGSPGRRSRRSKQSVSSTASVEEPPPSASRNTLITEVEPAGGALLTSLPVPVSFGMTSWDWPLSREEKKALVVMFDRQELMVQRDEYADQLQGMKLRCKQLSVASSHIARQLASGY